MKKKRDPAKLVAVLLGAAMGVSLGLCAGNNMGKLFEGNELLGFLLLIPGLLAAVLVHAVLHEAGHLLFGLLTGYGFVSFSILGIVLTRRDGKYRLGRFKLPGAVGQCLMSPPESGSTGDMPYLLYNLGGVIVNAVTSLLCLLLYFMSDGAAARLVWFFLFNVGAYLALTNGIPLRMGTIDNDGRNALACSRDKTVVRDMWIQMSLAREQAEGRTLSQMPDEWFIMPETASMGNGISAAIGVFCCNRLLEQHRFEECYDEMRSLLSAKTDTVPLHRSLLISDCIYCELVLDGRHEIVDRYLTEQQKKFMKSTKSLPGTLRTEYTVALLHEHDPAKAQTIRKQFDKVLRGYPYPADAEVDRRLMEYADSRA